MRAILCSLIMCACLARGLGAAAWAPLPGDALAIEPYTPSEDSAEEAVGPRLLFSALAEGAHALIALPAGVTSFKDAKGGLTRQALEALLTHGGQVYFLAAEKPALDRALARVPKAALAQAKPAGAGPVVVLAGAPTLLLLENSSTIAPLSKPLERWGLRYEVAGFDQVEKAPAQWLDPARHDVAAFSSPGWWDDFANPPSGPSRMGEPVARALRSFVADGGSAMFSDLSQWDMEKAWPGTVKLSPLGPYKAQKFKARDPLKGGKLALAPFGVAAETVGGKGQVPVRLFHQPQFRYVNGRQRPVMAAYALKDPGNGRGLVFGQAYHPFEQEEDAGPTAKRVFLNSLLAAAVNQRGTLWTGGDFEAPFSPTPRPSASSTSQAGPTETVSPSQTPLATDSPSPVPSRTATSAPTETTVPSRTPSPSPAAPSSTATASATPEPRPSASRTPQRASAQPAAATMTPSFTLSPTPRATEARPKLPTPSSTATAYRRKPALPTPKATPTATRTWTRPRLQPSPTRTRTHQVWRSAASPTCTRTATQEPPPPTARPTANLAAPHSPNALGCLATAPEPFSAGGVYLYFCLREPAYVRIQIYDAWGKEQRVMGWDAHPSGDRQVFFDGRDGRGKALPPGLYYWALEASYADQGKERKFGSLNRR